VKRRLILIVFVVMLFGVATMVYEGQRQEQRDELYYSGTMEATQANLGFQVSGRVKEVLVDEGQGVRQGQILAVLDSAEFVARRDQAKAALVRAMETQKQLGTVLEINQGALPAEVERAEAGVKVLEAQLEELASGYRTQEVERALLALQAAEATMEEAGKDKDRFDDLFSKGIVAEKDKDRTDLKYATAFKEYERAKKAYELQREGFRRESVEAAKAKLAEGQAVLKQARSNLKKIEAAARELEAAKAQVEEAKASLDLAEIQLEYVQLKAPFAGVLTSRNVEPGEVVTAGREVLSLADLSEVDLKIFVDETEIGKIKPGQNVRVTVDTFPDKAYAGRVSFISPDAEFTPKIIQTHKERVKLVYLVKITVPNPALELKPGMPADAWFR
jgi:HlyD family secretion protein